MSRPFGVALDTAKGTFGKSFGQGNTFYVVMKYTESGGFIAQAASIQIGENASSTQGCQEKQEQQAGVTRTEHHHPLRDHCLTLDAFDVFLTESVFFHGNHRKLLVWIETFPLHSQFAA